MKKLIIVLSLLGVCSIAKADISSICTDWGKFNLCLPVTSGVDAAFGYDFKGSKSQGLAETGLASYSFNSTSKLVLKAGGVTTENGKGAPFIGLDYELKGITNPIPGFSAIQPGIYGGKDFHTNEYFYGVKASIPIIQ